MRRGFRVHDQRLIHFITSTTVHWIPVFTKQSCFEVLVDSFNYCIENKGLRVYGFVIMPTHFHALVSCEAGLSDVMRDLKAHSAKMLLGLLQKSGKSSWMNAFRIVGGENEMMQLWQPGLHPEEIHSESFFTQKLVYVHNNPVRSGFVSDPCTWVYSSAAFWEKESSSPIQITLPGEEG